MKSPIKCKYIIASLLFALPLTSYAQGAVESNPLQYAVITEGQGQINSKIKSQTKGMQKTAARQGAVAAEFTVMKRWEAKYNSYLKTAKGYAEALKAGTTLYAEGMQTLRHLYEIQKAVNANPEGVGATLALIQWHDIHVEMTAEFTKTHSLLKTSVAKGGKYNMLTGAERAEMIWQLDDELSTLNKKLKMLAISIAYHNLKDVWNQAIAGMVDKSHEQIAEEALERWQRASRVNEIFDD